MNQPSDWELLVLPYLSGELSDADKERFETHMAQNPDFARTVAEFRETMEMVWRAAPPAEAIEGLEGLESRVYRDIAARTTLRAASDNRRVLSAMASVFTGEWWRTLAGGLVVATASVAVGVYVGMRGVEPTPYAPVAQMTVSAPTRPASLDAEPHQKFMQNELEREFNEARLIHHVRGNTSAAIARYAQIVEENPQTWTSRVAEFEQSALLNAVETTQPLLNDDAKPIFTDVASR